MAYDFDTVYDRRNSDSAKWKYFADDVLPMWVADMDFKSPAPILEALHARVDEGIFGYAMNPTGLLPAIVARLDRRYGWKIEEEAIVTLSGLVSGLNITTRAIGEPGDGVLINSPVYGPFFMATTDQGRVEQIARQPVTIEADGRMRYSVDFDAVEAAITERTRLMLLCSPHNPLGTAYSVDELQQFAAIAEKYDLIICSDEIHCDLLLGGARHTPMASLSPQIAQRTITLMAPSKTFNLPGLGASFAVIPNKELREKFNKAAAGIVPHTSLLSTVAMKAAYTECEDWLEELLVYLTANRDFAVEYIQAKMPKVRYTVPDATYLMWLDFGAYGIEGDLSAWMMEHAKVAMNPGSFFGEDEKGFVRLNFGCPRETLAQGLDLIAEAIGGL